jgi:hypothetical protein
MPPSTADLARALGADFARFGLRAPLSSIPEEFQGGYEAQLQQQNKTKKADRFVRKWLQLRYNALKRGRVLDDAVTPALLRKLDIDFCPVTFETLTHGQKSPNDWSIDRIMNDGAYAPGNLCILSTKANLAKGNLSFEEIWSIAQQRSESRGLSSQEWMRLASSCYGAWAAINGDTLVVPMVSPHFKQSFQAPSHLAQRFISSAFYVRKTGEVLPKDDGMAEVCLMGWLEPESTSCATPLFDVLLNRFETAVAAKGWHDAWADSDVHHAFCRWWQATRDVGEPITRLLVACESFYSIDGFDAMTEIIRRWRRDSAGYLADTALSESSIVGN